MRIALVPAGLALIALTARAQDAPRWRFGITAAGPTRILDVNSNEVPDSNSSHMDLGFGFGLEATRLWWVAPKGGKGGAVGVYARASMARAKVEMGGEEFSPGWALIGEAGARLRRQIGGAFGIILGAGVSHWSGPDEAAPFSGLGPVLITGEGGVTVRLGPGFAIDAIANGTRFGSDDERSVSSGFVWRLMLGVHREK
jgi:hypothetical protein